MTRMPLAGVVVAACTVLLGACGGRDLGATAEQGIAAQARSDFHILVRVSCPDETTSVRRRFTCKAKVKGGRSHRVSVAVKGDVVSWPNVDIAPLALAELGR